MTRERLEIEFTSMLKLSDADLAYGKLLWNYVLHTPGYTLLSHKDMTAKLDALRYGNPREWITKIFTEGLQITPQLARLNALWLQHLEDVEWN